MMNMLVIMRDPTRIVLWIKEALQNNDLRIYTATTALSGFVKFNEHMPALIIVENDLSDISGISFSSILKDSYKGCKSTIYVFGVTAFLQNAKADYYFPQDIANNEDLFKLQIRSFWDKQFMKLHHSDEMLRAKIQQNEFLPDKLETKAFKVDTIYSPFNDLSGDGIDYWYGEDKDGLYGLLFDCTGHDIVSFLQVGEIRALLKKGCKYFQMGIISTLGEILKNANDDLFALHGDETVPTAAILFHFEFKKNKLHYCSAGIPSFLVHYRGNEKMNEILLKNYLLGYEPGVDYEEKEMLLDDVDEIVFSSDGFSELLFKKELDNAKHDDVSAILIQMKSCLK